jgi:hypothetical protein
MVLLEIILARINTTKMGGSSYFAGNKKALAANPGATGYSYGGGGSGGSNHASTAGQNGGAGAPGIVIITEFIV